MFLVSKYIINNLIKYIFFFSIYLAFNSKKNTTPSTSTVNQDTSTLSTEETWGRSHFRYSIQ